MMFWFISKIDLIESILLAIKNSSALNIITSKMLLLNFVTFLEESLLHKGI